MVLLFMDDFSVITDLDKQLRMYRSIPEDKVLLSFDNSSK